MAGLRQRRPGAAADATLGVVEPRLAKDRVPVKIKWDMSGATAVDGPSYPARSTIFSPAGKLVESASCQLRKGKVIYCLVDPQTKQELEQMVTAIGSRPQPLKIKLNVSGATVVDRPSYLARSIIISPAGKLVESTSCLLRKGRASAA